MRQVIVCILALFIFTPAVAYAAKPHQAANADVDTATERVVLSTYSDGVSATTPCVVLTFQNLPTSAGAVFIGTHTTSVQSHAPSLAIGASKAYTGKRKKDVGGPVYYSAADFYAAGALANNIISAECVPDKD